MEMRTSAYPTAPAGKGLRLGQPGVTAGRAIWLPPSTRAGVQARVDPPKEWPIPLHCLVLPLKLSCVMGYQS